MKTDRLTLVSLGYLYGPVCLFLFFWIHRFLAVPLVILLAIGIGMFVRQSSSATDSSPFFSGKEWLILAGGALFWAWVSGMGAFVPQYSDYDKHNLLFHDLIARPWPVVYQNRPYNDPFLCYYLAYYLPTAAVVKAFRWSFQAAEWVSLLWGWLGILLAFCWAARLSKKNRVWIAVGLPLLSGVEVAVRLFWSLYQDFHWQVAAWLTAVFNNRIPGYTRYETPRLAFSNQNFSQSLDPAPLVMQLQAVPQHALGGWIAIGLLVYWQNRQAPTAALAFVVAATLLWSPFVSIGLGVWLLLTQRNLWVLSSWLHPVFLAGSLVLTAVMGCFYQAHYPIPYAGFIIEAFNNPDDVALYVLFWGLQLWLGVVLFRGYNRTTGENNPWIRLAFFGAISIQLLSLIYMGRWNDFQNRTMIPAQLVFYLALANGFVHWLRSPKRSWAGRLFGLWILIGLYVPLRVVAYKLRSIPIRQPVERAIKTATTNFGETDLSRIRPHDAVDADANYAVQYIGKRDSFFYRYLFRH
ncbi:hypothetical protein GCM10027299_24660 [Larkinella ripae]